MMDEPMEASFDPGIDVVNLQNQGAQQVVEGGHLPSTQNSMGISCNNMHSDTSTISMSSSHPAGDSEDNINNKPHFTPLLRPGSMVMMTLTEEDYEMQYWPKLKTAIDQLLNIKPGAYIPISYEQMYSCVYKCVCKQFSERLYNDLLLHLSSHMEHLNQELKNHKGETIPYIETFSFLMHQYLQALSGIVPIFNYMNRFYVENKLKTDLNEELRKLFCSKVVDIHISDLIKLLDEVSSIPFAVSPPTMASVMKNLYALNEDYSKLNPALFSRYLPNILPPTDPSMLEHYAMEARRVQELIASTEFNKSAWKRHPEYIRLSHESSRKRVYEEDISVTI